MIKKIKFKTNYESTFHKDKTVSYWSVSKQVWKREVFDKIPKREINRMPIAEKEKILDMLKEKSNLII